VAVVALPGRRPPSGPALKDVEEGLTDLWPLLCESALQGFRVPGESLRTAADLYVRCLLLSFPVSQVPLVRGPGAAPRHTGRGYLSAPVGSGAHGKSFEHWLLARPSGRLEQVADVQFL
jgi:hypothetical protein